MYANTEEIRNEECQSNKKVYKLFSSGDMPIQLIHIENAGKGKDEGCYKGRTKQYIYDLLAPPYFWIDEHIYD